MVINYIDGFVCDFEVEGQNYCGERFLFTFVYVIDDEDHFVSDLFHQVVAFLTAHLVKEKEIFLQYLAKSMFVEVNGSIAEGSIAYP